MIPASVSPHTREQFRKGPEASGCVAIWPFYRDGKKLFLDPYPLLEIQDEAHLLDKSLGTFSGLFETTFHYALRELAPLLGNRVALLGGDSSSISHRSRVSHGDRARTPD